MAVNEQFLILMPTLDPGSMATGLKLYPSLDAMWKAFNDLEYNKTPSVNGENVFALPGSSTGTRLSAPSGPRPASYGRGQGRVPSQLSSWRTGSSHNHIVMSIDDPTDPWLDRTFNCWPLEENHFAEVFAVWASFTTDYPPLWSGLLSPSARAATIRENRGHCLNCHEDTYSFKQCRHPFINASCCLNPELGQLGDDDAYRRWQARMMSYRRNGKSSRTRNHKKNRSGQSRGNHQGQGQVNSHNANLGNP